MNKKKTFNEFLRVFYLYSPLSYSCKTFLGLLSRCRLSRVEYLHTFVKSCEVKIVRRQTAVRRLKLWALMLLQNTPHKQESVPFLLTIIRKRPRQNDKRDLEFFHWSLVTQIEPWGCKVHWVVIYLSLETQRGALANVIHPLSILTWMSQNQLPCSGFLCWCWDLYHVAIFTALCSVHMKAFIF